MSVLRTRFQVRALLALACALAPAGCDPNVIVGHARGGPHDAGRDAAQGADAGDASAVRDSGAIIPPHDAGPDAGFDAGRDAGADGGPDASEPIDAGTPLIGPRSQLRWVSGAHVGNVLGDVAAFESWRGRPLDLVMYFVDRTTGWPGIVTPSWPVDMIAPLPMRIVLSIPLYPEGMGNLADCAAGMYDSQWRKLGPFLSSKDRGDAIIRLGWGPNDAEHYWRSGDDPAEYIACFQHAAGAIRQTGPDLQIAWDFDDSAFPGSTALDPYSAYPGDDYVDYIGLEAFDMSPPVYDDAAWDAKCHSPTGLCSTLEFARMHGKRLGLSEWAVTSCYGEPGGDNPFYVQKFYDFFAANAGAMGFEIYYQDNSEVCSSLSDETDRKNAAERYRTLYAKP